MQYRKDKYGNRLSILGYGCMRFTEKFGKIDLEKTEKEIMTAYKGGVNYYDTAYVYGGSEAALGKILDENKIRDKVYIATKLPHYLIKKSSDPDKYFSEELKRLRTDHVDYYLMHMLTDVRTWQRLLDLGIGDWLKKKRESGEIRQVGFSYHGNSDMFCQLLDAYDWDFCQIQYNYMDEHSQAGRTGLKHAGKKGIPVMIMEPLRGGRLVNNLPPKAKKLFSIYPEKRTPAEWSFLWLWNQPEVTCVLSGMNSIAMVKENVRNASRAGLDKDPEGQSAEQAPSSSGTSDKDGQESGTMQIAASGFLSKRDHNLLRKVAAAINARMKVPCTGCRYCMPCPQHVDIPGTFAAYNRKYTDSGIVARKEYVMCTLLRQDPTSASRCIECGKCEQHCPQGIAIRDELKKAVKELEGPYYKIASKVMKRFVKY